MSIDIRNLPFHVYITDGGTASNYALTIYGYPAIDGDEAEFSRFAHFRFRADAEACAQYLNDRFSGKVSDHFAIHSPEDFEWIVDVLSDFADQGGFPSTHSLDAEPWEVVSNMDGISFNNRDGEAVTISDADAQKLAEGLASMVSMREVHQGEATRGETADERNAREIAYEHWQVERMKELAAQMAKECPWVWRLGNGDGAAVVGEVFDAYEAAGVRTYAEPYNPALKGNGEVSN